MTCQHKRRTNRWGSKWWVCDSCGKKVRRAAPDDHGRRFNSFGEWESWWHSTMDRMTNHWADSPTRARLENARLNAGSGR